MVAVRSTMTLAQSGYRDLDDAGVHVYNVSYLDYLGFFDGTDCDLNQFCPTERLQRWVLAVWLVRALDRANPQPGSTSGFSDVEPGTWWAPYVDRLADLGVTAGCASGQQPRFCPEAPVTRAQMATFLKRAYDLDGAPSFGFTDIVGSVHEVSINALAASGITAGCGTNPKRFCPTAAVTRAQMASFIARALRAEEQLEGREPLSANTVANTVVYYETGPITLTVPVYYCVSENAGYTLGGLQDEVLTMNQLVSGFFGDQSGGQAQISFKPEAVISPTDIDWGTANLSSWIYDTDDPCRRTVLDTRGRSSDNRVVVLVDVPTGIDPDGTKWGGSAYYDGVIIMQTLKRWSNDALSYANTLAHEIGHSILNLRHTFDENNVISIPEDVCSLMSYCGPNDISRTFIADRYCDYLGWADPPGSGCPTVGVNLPGVPTNVQVSVGDRQLTVAWTAPLNAVDEPITGYTVTVYDASSTPIMAGPVGASDRSAQISGLTNGAPYTITVHAHTRSGTGQPSVPAGATPIAAGIPPGVPVVRVGTRTNRVVVSWSADDNGSPIDRWQVELYEGSGGVVGGRSSRVTGLDAGPDTTSYEWDLSTGEYFVYVRAHNAGGWSEWETGDLIVVGEPPTLPTVNAHTGRIIRHRIEARWSADDNGLRITGWQVQLNRVGSGKLEADREYSASQTSTEWFLAGSGDFDVRVRAKNAAGWSEWGVSAQVTVGDREPPGWPGVQATNTTNGYGSYGLEATWFADDNGRPIDRWEYSILLSDGEWSIVESGEFSGATTGYEWPLPPGGYIVKVRAHNAVGWSEWGESQQVTVGEPPPAPNLTVSVRGNSIEARWSADDNSRPIDRWRVLLYAIDENDIYEQVGATIEVSVSTTRWVWSNMVPGQYMVEARGHNAGGWGGGRRRYVHITVAEPPAVPVATVNAQGNRIKANWSAEDNGWPIHRWQVQLGRVHAS